MPKARTAKDFAAAHVREVYGPNKIRTALAKILETGPEHWEYEGDLAKPPYGLSNADLTEFRDQFAPYWVTTAVQSGKAARRVWFGDAKVAAKFRAKAS